MAETRQRIAAIIRTGRISAFRDRGVTYTWQRTRGGKWRREPVHLQQMTPDVLVKIVRKLPEPENIIIEQSFGLRGKERSLPLIARELGLSFEDAELFYADGLERIRKAIEDLP